MAGPVRVSGLDVEQDLVYQRTEWRVQRAGWLIMLLVGLLALVGLLGPGPLSGTTEPGTGAIRQITYKRFIRYRAPTDVQVILDPAAVQEGTLRLALSRTYMDRVTVRDVDPEPSAVELTHDRLIYVFEAQGDGPLHVALEMEPSRFGRLSLVLQVEQEPALSVDQWVYP